MIGEADMDRRDGAARMASTGGADRFSDAVFSASAIDHLRADVESLRTSLAAAASPDVLRDVDRAMGVLSRQVKDARSDARQAEQAGVQFAATVGTRIDSLRDSIESLRAAEPAVALASAVEAMSRKLDIVDAKAVDPVTVARLQLQTAELKDLVGRSLAHATRAAEQVRQEAAQQLAEVGAGALEAVTAASADFGRIAAETLTRIEGRLEQHLAAQAAPAPAASDDLAALRDRLDHLSQEVRALAPATDGRLAAQVAQLLERIDQGGGIEAATLAPLVGVLERHLVTLTERMGESQARLQRLDGIETLLQRMTGDMQRMRESLVDAGDAVQPELADTYLPPVDLPPVAAAPLRSLEDEAAVPHTGIFATLDEAGQVFREMYLPHPDETAPETTPERMPQSRDPEQALDDAPETEALWLDILGPAFLQAAALEPELKDGGPRPVPDLDPEPFRPAADAAETEAPKSVAARSDTPPLVPEWHRRDMPGLPTLPAAGRRQEDSRPAAPLTDAAPVADWDDLPPGGSSEPAAETSLDGELREIAQAMTALAQVRAEPRHDHARTDHARTDHAASAPETGWPAHEAVALWVVPEARRREVEDASVAPAPRPRGVAPSVAGERATHDTGRGPRQKPVGPREAAALDAALSAASAEDEAPRVRLDWVAAADRAEHREKGVRIARKRRSERRIHTALRLGGVAAAILVLGLVTVKLTARAGGTFGLQALVTAPAATDGSGPAPVDKSLLSALPPPVGPAALKTAALAGDADAACEVGLRYADGKGTDVDIPAAMKWLGFAAAHGSVPAAYRLGSLYEFSIRNVAEAKRLYQWAAERGNLRAMHSVGVLYSDGIDGKPDWSNAITWFRKAAERGLRDSQYNLGVIYGRGLGGAVDRAEAWKWFSLAANQGDTDSARKRDDVANKAEGGVVERAKAAVAAFVPGPVVEAANTVPVKPEWEVASPADMAPRKSASRS